MDIACFYELCQGNWLSLSIFTGQAVAKPGLSNGFSAKYADFPGW